MEMTFDPYMPPLLCGTVKFSLPVAVCSQFFETPSRKCFPPQILTSFVCVSLICLLSSKKHAQKQEEGVKEAIRLNGGGGLESTQRLKPGQCVLTLILHLAMNRAKNSCMV